MLGDAAVPRRGARARRRRARSRAEELGRVDRVEPRREYEKLVAWIEGDHDAQAELDAEDHALLLRAWQLRVGPLPGRGAGRSATGTSRSTRCRTSRRSRCGCCSSCLDQTPQHHARRRHPAAHHGRTPASRRGRRSSRTSASPAPRSARSRSATAARARSPRFAYARARRPPRGRDAAAHARGAARRSSCSGSATTAPASRSSPTR